MKTLHYSIIIIGIAISVILGGIILLTPSNQTVTLSGDKALQVCAAVKVPCVTNPTFQATKTGFDTYVVIFKINDKQYRVTISGATSSVVPIESSPINNTSPNVSTIIIPKGSDDPSSGKNYEPRFLTVVLGVNNTVQWINEADEPNTIVADTYNQPDPLFEKGPYSHGIIRPGKSFNFTFTKPGEFQYDTEPHPWLYGWVLVLPQSPENTTKTVIVNDTKIHGPCEIFALPCPNSTSFTAQKFGSDVYIEKVTINGVDKYAVVHPLRNCVYPPSYRGYETCRNPDDLAILRLAGVDTSIPQENINIAISGLEPSYMVGQPINFGISISGYGHCDSPSVLVIHEGNIVWKDKSSQISCPYTMQTISHRYIPTDFNGPFSLNQTGTYTVHAEYASNMTEEQFNVILPNDTSIFDTGITHMSANVTNTNFTVNYNIEGAKVLGIIFPTLGTNGQPNDLVDQTNPSWSGLSSHHITDSSKLQIQSGTDKTDHLSKIPQPQSNLEETVRPRLDTLQLPFIQNQGQTDKQVRFYANTFGGKVFVTDDSLIYSIAKDSHGSDKVVKPFVSSFQERILGTHAVYPAGLDRSTSNVSYFIGNKKSDWRTDIPTWDTVSMGQPWPGIDVKLRAHGNNVEKIFTIQPGAKPDRIKLGMDGVIDLGTDDGKLQIRTESGTMSMTKPLGVSGNKWHQKAC